MMEKKRSIGVKVLGVGLLLWLIVNILVLGCLPFFALSENISFSSFLNNEKELFGNEFLFLLFPITIIYYINVLYNICVLIASIGILKFKGWGRKLLFTMITIEFLWICGDFILAGQTLDIAVIIEIIIMAGLLYFFTRPKVKEQFK